jgi:hypothetical protein
MLASGGGCGYPSNFPAHEECFVALGLVPDSAHSVLKGTQSQVSPSLFSKRSNKALKPGSPLSPCQINAKSKHHQAQVDFRPPFSLLQGQYQIARIPYSKVLEGFRTRRYSYRTSNQGHVTPGLAGVGIYKCWNGPQASGFRHVTQLSNKRLTPVTSAIVLLVGV